MSEKIDNIVSTNTFNDKYSSLTRSIKIFLPVRESKKKDEGEYENYDDFVGRERLMERLYNWLSDKNKASGSYLVTGFRGMGKTSLVTRVTDRLTREIKQKSERWYFWLLMLPLVGFGALYSSGVIDSPQRYVYVIIPALVFVALGVFGFCNKYNRNNRKRHKYPHGDGFEDVHVDRMARGKEDDLSEKKFSNIKYNVPQN